MSRAIRPAAATRIGRATHPVPERHAWAVQTLLDAGAELIGKTITDEVSLGILGENPFEGTPANPRAPGRVPGGSSAGSAAAVAAGICDIALGTDTGGSVRVPASFCGIYGIRPTHGRLDLAGMMAQAPSSDTTGWFARDAETFARVSSVMLGEPIPAALPRRLVIATRCLRLRRSRHRRRARTRGRPAARADRRGARGRDGAAGARDLGAGAAHAAAVRGVADFSGLDRARQSAPPVQRRTQSGSGAAIPAAERAWASLVREEARGRMRQLLPPGTILCLPTTPFPAPRRGQPLSAHRRAAQPHHLPVRAWRADRRAAGQFAGGDGRRFAGRAVDHRTARQRCGAGGRGARVGRVIGYSPGSVA